MNQETTLGPPMKELGAIGRELWIALPTIAPHITQADKLWAFLLCRSWETYILSDTLLRDLMFPEKAETTASERRERSKASWRMAMRTSMTSREWAVKILGLLEYHKEGGGIHKFGTYQEHSTKRHEVWREVGRNT